MRRTALGWWRLAKQVVLGATEAVASFANSTLTAASATGTADGSTANTLTLTLRDTNNALMPFKDVTFTTELTAVDAGETTLVDDAAEIAATTGTLNLILVLRNAAGVGLPNIQSARIVYSSTGTGNTFGTPSVTDRNGQSLCTFSSTVAEAKTISVTVDGVAVTQTAAVTVTGGAPSQPALDFASQFRTTGTDNGNILDDTSTTPWTLRGGSGGEVIASTGLDFPSTNVLRISDVYVTARKTGMSVPAATESVWYRWYIRVTTEDDLGDNQTHPIQDGLAQSDANWQFEIRSYPDTATSAGTWRMLFRTNGGAFSVSQWRLGVNLSKSETYRVELQVYRIDATTWNLHVWVYDSSDVLLYSDADFTNAAVGGSSTLADTPTLTFVDVANLDGLNCGTNGLQAGEVIYGYQGCFARSVVGKIGPYVANEEAP